MIKKILKKLKTLDRFKFTDKDPAIIETKKRKLNKTAFKRKQKLK